MSRRSGWLVVVFVAVLGLAWLLHSAGQPTQAAPGEVLVDRATGTDQPDCGDGIHPPCFSIKYAVESVAAVGDTVLVAAGTYTETFYMQPGVAIVSASGPEQTIIDGEGKRGPMVSATDQMVTSTARLEGFTVTGGNRRGITIEDASPVISNCTIYGNYGHLFGGGIGISKDLADVLVSRCRIFSNTASYRGGGIWVNDYATLTLVHSRVTSNSVSMDGGGVFLRRSEAELLSNTIAGNRSCDGGGIYLEQSQVTARENVVSGNQGNGGIGGGFHQAGGTTFLERNTILGNYASAGGGLGWDRGKATLTENVISANSAYSGGGLAMASGTLTLYRNVISGNSAYSWGGGIVAEAGNWWFNGNLIVGNTAARGGGLYLNGEEALALRDDRAIPVLLQNDVVAGNQVSEVGSGLYIRCQSLALQHLTIASNGGGDGSAVYLIESTGCPSTVILTNTILADQAVGITVTTGNEARWERMLWGSGLWANGTDWGGDGTIVPGAADVWGDPAFVDPGAGDYHVSPRSAAVDAGVGADVADDMDGEPRPRGCGPDIGADEYQGLPPLDDLQVASVVEGGEALTVTLAWSPPAQAVTTTLRTSPTRVTDENWLLATLLTDTLPGNTGQYTATVPYAGDTVYFAAKWAACGDVSTVSNHACWPPWYLHLPLVLRGPP